MNTRSENMGSGAIALQSRKQQKTKQAKQAGSKNKKQKANTAKPQNSKKQKTNSAYADSNKEPATKLLQPLQNSPPKDPLPLETTSRIPTPFIEHARRRFQPM